MIKKNKLKDIAGITLIEIMIGVVISAIMMGAMYTTYSIVNSSYSQVTDRAKISRSGRDIIAMLMRDIRLAGFKYYYGENATDIPKQDNLQYNSGNSDIEKSHDPIIVIKDDLSDATESDTAISKNDEADKCCDKIHIVYGDFNQNDEQPYKRYRVTYYAKPSGESEYYAVYKSKQSWIQSSDDSTGDWSSSCTECFSGELIRDHLVDMEFIVFDKQGRIIDPPPRPDESSRVDLYNIKAVDIRLTFRSKNEFYRFKANEEKPRFVKGLGERTRKFLDKYLRDSVVVTVNTRNIGS
jgi:type II secretory pathway component PulJ